MWWLWIEPACRCGVKTIRKTAAANEGLCAFSEKAGGGGREARSPGASRLDLAPQAFVRVFDEQVADRETSPLGFGGEPFGQFGRQDDGATDAIVAFPHLIGGLRQAPSSRTPSVG